MKPKNRIFMELGRVYQKEKNSYAKHYRKKLQLKQYNGATPATNPQNLLLYTSTSLENISSRYNDQFSPKRADFNKTARQLQFNQTQKAHQTSKPVRNHNFSSSRNNLGNIQKTIVASPFSQTHINNRPNGARPASPQRQPSRQQRQYQSFSNFPEAIRIEDSPPHNREDLALEHKSILDKIKKVKETMEAEKKKIQNAQLMLKQRKKVLNQERKTMAPLSLTSVQNQANTRKWAVDGMENSIRTKKIKLKQTQEEFNTQIAQYDKQIAELEKALAQHEMKSQHLGQKIEYYQGVKQDQARKSQERKEKKSQAEKTRQQQSELLDQKQQLQDEISRIEATISNFGGPSPVSNLVSVHLSYIQRLRTSILRREYQKLENYVRARQEAKNAKRQGVRLKQQIAKKREENQSMRRKAEEKRKTSEKLQRTMQQKMATLMELMAAGQVG